MSGQTELITAKYLTEPTEVAEPTQPMDLEMTPPRANPTAISQVVRGVQNFVIVMVFLGLLGVVGRWACTSASESTTCADWFLWVAGSDKNWEEYQKNQVRKGNPRLKDKEMTWMQQLFNDAYAGNNR
jgi:hypothetical protein